MVCVVVGLASCVHCVDGLASVVRCGDFVAFTQSLIIGVSLNWSGVYLSDMSNLNTEFQEPLTRLGVKHDEEMSICSSTPQVHGGYINSSLLESDLKICHVDVVSFDENMSDNVSDLSIITKFYEGNKHSLMNKTAMENRTNIVTIDEIRRHRRAFAAIQENKDRVRDVCTDSSLNICKNGDEEVFRRSKSKSKLNCKYACRDREPSRLRFRKIIKMF